MQAPVIPLDPILSAKTAGLRHVSDDGPGIRRVRSGRGFKYVAPDGAAVREPATLARIDKLAIPPAWTKVWICPVENGHIQATGRDARGRKQYRYHARWREVRDETKYHKMLAFAAALPAIRAAVAKDLARAGLPRDKVIATVVRLLETTDIRVGNEEYARENGSFGLTTLRNRHVDVRGSEILFHFRGKSGKVHQVGVKDRRLARIVEQCSDLPGHELFQYVDENGQTKGVESSDVNEYLKRVAGEELTAKDFRTWSGTVLAARALREACRVAGERRSKTATRKRMVEAIKQVAARLGNTPAVCRKCYVHPAVFDAYLEGQLADALATESSRSDPNALSAEEAAVLALLEESAAREKDPRRLEKQLRKSVRVAARSVRRSAR